MFSDICTLLKYLFFWQIWLLHQYIKKYLYALSTYIFKIRQVTFVLMPLREVINIFNSFNFLWNTISWVNWFLSQKQLLEWSFKQARELFRKRKFQSLSLLLEKGIQLSNYTFTSLILFIYTSAWICKVCHFAFSVSIIF